MTNKDEWARLKENEKYALIGRLFTRVEKLEAEVTKLKNESK